MEWDSPLSIKCIIGAMTSADNEVTMGMYKSFHLSLIILSLINITSDTESIISINMNKVVKIHLLCNSTVITSTELYDTIGYQYMEYAVKTKVFLTYKGISSTFVVLQYLKQALNHKKYIPDSKGEEAVHLYSTLKDF